MTADEKRAAGLRLANARATKAARRQEAAAILTAAEPEPDSGELARLREENARLRASSGVILQEPELACNGPIDLKTNTRTQCEDGCADHMPLRLRNFPAWLARQPQRDIFVPLASYEKDIALGGTRVYEHGSLNGFNWRVLKGAQRKVPLPIYNLLVQSSGIVGNEGYIATDQMRRSDKRWTTPIGDRGFGQEVSLTRPASDDWREAMPGLLDAGTGTY